MAQNGFKSIFNWKLLYKSGSKINNSLVSLVFNMDKAGDDYIDTHTYHILVPKE